MDRIIYNLCAIKYLLLGFLIALAWFSNVVQRRPIYVEIISAISTFFGHIRWFLFLFFTIKSMRRYPFRVQHRILIWKLHHGINFVSITSPRKYLLLLFGENIHISFLKLVMGRVFAISISSNNLGTATQDYIYVNATLKAKIKRDCLSVSGIQKGTQHKIWTLTLYGHPWPS